jgi:sulfite exporter TauE/SafE/copper chaperone CopZ
LNIKNMKKTYKIKGMTCNSCAMLIEKSLKNKVNSAHASFSKEEVEVDFNEDKVSEKEIIKAIEKAGYEVADEKDTKKNFFSKYNTSNKVGFIFAILSFLLLIYVLFHFFIGNIKIPEVALPEIGDKAGLGLLFLVGILTGFHCVSMCGGFVVSYTAKNAMNGHKSYKQHFAYGGAKVISYTVIGGVFGLIGGILAFSVGLRAGVAIFAGVFMIFYALSMFGLKFFRRFQLNPKFLTKFTIKASANAKGQYKGPIITGLLNGLFIACGPLQAMYLYAAGTGSFANGATALAVFGLGTLPIMIGFGAFASVISHKTTKKILKISAIIVLILGLIMLNRGLSMAGSPYSFSAIQSKIAGNSAIGGTEAVLINGVQEINMDVSASGYSPNSFVLKKGIPVKWNVNVKQLTGCNQELVLRQYGIDENLKVGLNVIEFTPDKEGTIQFTCGMGMLRGSFIVTESGTASQEQIKSATPSSGGSCGGGCGCGG